MNSDPHTVRSARLEEFLDPSQFPDELAWVPAHYKIHPNDPVYLLIAWHWRRVKASEDTLAAGILELRTLLDARADSFTQAAETVSGVHDLLASLQVVLEEKPAELSEQLDAMLARPIDNALQRLQTLEKSLGSAAQNFEKSKGRQVLAALLAGVALGVLAAVIVLLA
jgi:hypothetical protein